MATNREAGVATDLPGSVGGHGAGSGAPGGGARLPVFARVDRAGEDR